MKTYCIVLGSFNGPEPGVDDKKVKERKKEANIPWVTQKTNKALDRACTAHVSTGRPLKKSWEVLEAWAGKWARQASALHGISQKERERERKKDTRTQVSGGTRVLYWILCEYYIPYYKVASSDKDQKTRLNKLPRKQGALESIRPKGNP